MKVIFERIEAEFKDKRWFEGGGQLFRAKVPGGWLVLWSAGEQSGTTFYPDPDHRWGGNSLP